MMAVIFGLATGFAFGSQDFFGGMASRRASPLAVVALFKVITLLMLAITVPITGGTPSSSTLAWGAFSGLAIGAGNIAYFRAMSIGRMGVVATIVAIWSAVIPLAAGVAFGERPDQIVWIGIVAIIASIGLITYTPRSMNSDAGTGESLNGIDVDSPEQAPLNPLRSGLPEASLGGMAFGLFFVALSQASSSSGGLVWPLLASTVVAMLLVGTVALLRGVEWKPALTQWPAILAAGVLYAGANWFFILGVSGGWVSIVAVMAALSPLPTMILARLILCETLARRQIAGVAVALAGVVVITLSAGT